jgi:methionyl-tRNA formyltransferase
LAAPPRIALLALAGVGNAVLRALCSARHKPLLVVTRPESGPFPYYDEADLPNEARRLGVDCFFDGEGEARVASLQPDLVFVATYHRILGPAFRAACRHIVNLHPSLLPRYRGSNPFFWVLRNGERLTGLTAHELTAQVDGGPVYWQRAIDIASDETQGTLRRRLAALAANAATDIADLVQADRLAGTAQDETKATAFAKPGDLERTLSADLTLDEALRIVRATLPYPGALVGPQAVRKVLRTWRGSSGERNAGAGVLLELRDGAILFEAAGP